jgi:hypothetical protein
VARQRQDRGAVGAHRAHRGFVGQLRQPPAPAAFDAGGRERATLDARQCAIDQHDRRFVGRQRARARHPHRMQRRAFAVRRAFHAHRPAGRRALLQQFGLAGRRQPARRATCALPRVGWPAKAISWRVVKMRTR